MMTPNLIVCGALFDKIIGRAQRSSPNECIGLLARRPVDAWDMATAICQLPAAATPDFARAAPIDISLAVHKLRKRGLVPSGIWHSHGEGSVHHSLQDDETIARILPAMAEDNYQRPTDATAVFAPIVTAPDEAELPLPDGTMRHFTLLGPLLPGLDGRQRIAWKSIATRFRERPVLPRAVFKMGFLHLAGGQVVLSLGLPEGSTVESQVVDRAPLRTAHLYSLVVNAKGETHLEVLTIHDIEGRSFVQQKSSAVEVLPESSSRTIAGPIPEPGRLPALQASGGEKRE
jgi:proteasome lid subunit RPN8/RPN11